MVQITFPKNKPLQIYYRNNKHLDKYSFNLNLKLVLSNTDIQICEEFEEIFMNIAPCTFKKENFKSW